MMKKAMAVLSAVLLSGVAVAETSEARIEKTEAQLTAEHGEVQAKNVASEQKVMANHSPVFQAKERAQTSSAKADKAPLEGLPAVPGPKQGKHDAAKADANLADSSASLGTGSSVPPSQNKAVANKTRDAAKADANMADASGSLGTGSSTRPSDNKAVANKTHDAAKADANMADASGSLGTGASARPESRGSVGNSYGGQRNDGRTDSAHHEGVHGAKSGQDRFHGGAAHSGVCHHGQQGC